VAREELGVASASRSRGLVFELQSSLFVTHFGRHRREELDEVQTPLWTWSSDEVVGREEKGECDLVHSFEMGGGECVWGVGRNLGELEGGNGRHSGVSW